MYGPLPGTSNMTYPVSYVYIRVEYDIADILDMRRVSYSVYEIAGEFASLKYTEIRRFGLLVDLDT